MSSTISMSICVNFVSKCPKLMTKRQREYTVDRGNHVSKCSRVDMTRNQINDTFLFQKRVKVKVAGEVSEK